MTKKILFILPSLSVGGLERMQVTLANALSNAGYSITILTLTDNLTLADELDHKVALKCMKQREFPFLGRVKFVRNFFEDGIWDTRKSSKALHRYYVGKEHYDVEIAFFRGLPIKIIAGSKAHAKLAWVHSDFRKASGYNSNFKSMRDVYKAYSSYDRVICVSNQAQEGFKEIIGDTGNLTTIYNMLHVEDIQRKAIEPCSIPVERHTLNLVLVGRLLDNAKGQRRLISAVSALQEESLDVGLVLVGDGTDRDLIDEKIKQCKAEGFVQMLGMQRNPYLYIKQADLLVCASFFEGYNLTVAEALILNTPVLSTDCNGPNEILDYGKYGMIVDNSEEGLYKGIKNFYEKPELMDYYKQKAKDRKDFFDEEKILSQITSLFN